MSAPAPRRRAGAKHAATPGPRARRPRRTQAERSAEATEKLLAAASACLTRYGYAATSITEIAEQAGMSRGALQHHFETKADLLFAVFARFSASLVAALEMVDERLPVPARAEAMVRALWARFADPGYSAMLELMVGSRSEALLWKRVCRRRDSDGEAMMAAMEKLFADTGHTARHLADTLGFTTATLRGLALYRLFVSDADFYANAIDWLAGAVALRVARA
jgi:AcrR family transcriptional regulator